MAAASVVHVLQSKERYAFILWKQGEMGAFRGVFDLATTETDSLKRNAWIPGTSSPVPSPSPL